MKDQQKQSVKMTKHVQASKKDQIISNVIGTLLLWRLISIRFYLQLFWKYYMNVLLLF